MGLLANLAVLSQGNAQKETYPVEAIFKIPPNGQVEKFMSGADFEMPTAIAFDSMNRLYIMNNRNIETYSYILTLRSGQWVKLSYLSAIKKLFGSIVKPQLPDDKDDDLYVIIAVPGQAKDEAGKVYRRGRVY